MLEPLVHHNGVGETIKQLGPRGLEWLDSQSLKNENNRKGGQQREKEKKINSLSGRLTDAPRYHGISGHGKTPEDPGFPGSSL